MCPCQCFSCRNFWAVEKAKLGQGEQRTGYFFFRSSSDCIVHIYSAFVLINNLMGYFISMS